MNEYENDLVKAGTNCTLLPKQEVAESLSKVNSNLGKINDNELDNNLPYKATSCLIESLTYVAPYSEGSLTSNDKIREHIRNLKRIGAASANGVALQADFNDNKQLFVVKAPLNSNTDLLHELIVGLYGTNFLRQDIPNFAYIYGGFKCGSPFVDDHTKEVTTWCLDNDNTVNYVLYENIKNSISLTDYVKVCTEIEFLDAILQSVLSLRHANNVIDYTHYDAHDENILIRKLNDASSGKQNNMFSIRYPTKRGDRYINTDFIATFIDQGMAHIQTRAPKGYESRSVGYLNYPYSIVPDKSYIWHDIYKLLMFCLLDAYEGENIKVVNLCKTLYRFFNKTDDPITALTTEWDMRYAFAYNKEWKERPVDDFIDYLFEKFDVGTLFTEKPLYPLIQCSKLCSSQTCDNSCSTNERVYQDIGLFNDKVDTIIGYYESYDNKPKDFDFNSAMKRHIEEIYYVIDELESTINATKLVNLDPYTDIFNLEILRSIKQLYLNSSIIYDDLTKFKMLYNVGVKVASEFGNISSQTELSNLKMEFDAYQDRVETIRDNLTEVNDIIVDTLSQMEKVPKEYSWYDNQRVSYAVALGI
jgi:hypothetical protein